MPNLGKSIDALMESYSRYGLVNPAGEANLPSKKSIEGILRELTELVLPGFGEMEALDHDNLALITAERVNRTARNLEREVEKSVAFGFRESTRPDHAFAGQAACGADEPLFRGCHAAAELLVADFFEELPAIRKTLDLDIRAALGGDPAAKSLEEVILSYPGLEAITVHRLAHFFWIREVPLIPRMMSEIIHHRTGIDIHPGAEIGESFFIDHGTGVVIGETTVIGKNVKLYQGVTLGALSVKKELAGKKRHPTIEEDVTIYSGATILGDTVIGRGSVIGGNVWITRAVAPNSTVYVDSGNQILEKRNG
ncbi:MAG: serine O-acetyltransferase [Treponema sp.]|jgi:serine O-acetyltransferase|nr:serine O-acetyltransferase [Treponema sp.]